VARGRGDRKSLASFQRLKEEEGKEKGKGRLIFPIRGETGDEPERGEDH